MEANSIKKADKAFSEVALNSINIASIDTYYIRDPAESIIITSLKGDDLRRLLQCGEMDDHTYKNLGPKMRRLQFNDPGNLKIAKVEALWNNSNVTDEHREIALDDSDSFVRLFGTVVNPRLSDEQLMRGVSRYSEDFGRDALEKDLNNLFKASNPNDIVDVAVYRAIKLLGSRLILRN